jgi:glycosyltransferase involved in cell wall biosynthesis
MKRLLYFASSYGCGLTALCVEHACAMASHGADLVCISDPREQYPGLAAILDRHHIQNKNIPGLEVHAHLPTLVRQLREQLVQLRPEVIQVQTNWHLLLVLLALRGTRMTCKVVCWLHAFRHNYPVKSVIAQAMIGTSLAVAADRVIVSSSSTWRKFAFLGSKLWLSMLGVEESFFQPYQPIEALPTPIRLIFAGEFRKGKNQEWLVRSLSEYRQQSGDNNVQLVLPGEGPLRLCCQDLARRLGVEDFVEFPGSIDRRQMLQQYQRAHCALVPTNYETFGLSIAEPLVLGKIVISRRVGCAEDAIVHGHNGFFFDTQPELTDLLVRILPDLTRWSHIGLQAFEQRKVFSWKTIVPAYLQMLEHL